jgi:hypothetical protein
MNRRAVIHKRRFYWYEDGRLSPIRVTERLLAQVRQSSYQTQVQATHQRAERESRGQTHD